MTVEHEASLANELKIPFVSICIVDNMGHGVEPFDQLSYEGFKKAAEQNAIIVEKIAGKILDHIPELIS
jgi:purine nucleoside phosphorylase